MEHLEVVHALENCELFSELEQSDIEKIAGLCQVQTYRPGEHIFRQGERGESLYIISEGHVCLERAIDLGTRRGTAVIGILGRGRALGCWSTLLGESHDLMTSAICQKDTRVVIIRGADLRDIMLENLGLGLKVFQNLCYMLRERIQGVFGVMEKV